MTILKYVPHGTFCTGVYYCNRSGSDAGRQILRDLALSQNAAETYWGKNKRTFHGRKSCEMDEDSDSSFLCWQSF